MAELTPAQVTYFVTHLPDVELRRAYPLAALEATVLNALGGKADPNDESAKTIPPERSYRPTERLPWYAKPAWLDEADVGVPADAARDFVAARRAKRVPAWVLQVAPIDQIERAAG